MYFKQNIPANIANLSSGISHRSQLLKTIAKQKGKVGAVNLVTCGTLGTKLERASAIYKVLVMVFK